MAAELSVILPTRDRAESLERTLRDLATPAADPRVEVIVVDNGEGATLDRAVLERAGWPAARLLHESRPGKGAALNRAIEAGGLAPLVAVLDDDMAPQPGWCAAVIESSAARPRFDVFAGRSHVVWPERPPKPSWADAGLAQGLQFSVLDVGEEEREMGDGIIAFPSGNHFWFRRSLLTAVPRFDDVWAPEIEFVMRARVAGHRGLFVPGVRCGHRVQPALFDARGFVRRAGNFGAILGRVEGLGSPTRRPRRMRALASTARWSVSALRSRLLGAWAFLLPAHRGVPLRAKAARDVQTKRVRIRRSWREFTTSPSRPA